MVPTHDEARSARARVSIEDGSFLTPDQAEVRVAFDRHLVARDGNLDEVLIRFAQRVHAAEGEREALREQLAASESRLVRAQEEIGRRYTKGQVGDLQASEAELVSAPLRREIADLKSRLEEARTINGRLVEQGDMFRARVGELDQRAAGILRRAEHAERNQRETAAELTCTEVELEQARKDRDAMQARLLKGHVCTSACRENSHVAFEGRELVRDLERQLAEVKAESAQWEARFGQEVERANSNKAWAERAEQRVAEAGLTLVESRKTSDAALLAMQTVSSERAARLHRIAELVNATPAREAVKFVQDRVGIGMYPKHLAEVIEGVRGISS